MKKIGPLHKAMAPSNFTFGSHASMFVGFTPGIANQNEPFLNPKFGKIFKMRVGGFGGKKTEYFTLDGENIIQGFNKLGYATFATGSVGWFDPHTIAGKVLVKDFKEYFFPGRQHFLEKQLEWVNSKIQEFEEKPVFIFMNIGETHVPYYYQGAPWDRKKNPCIPFGKNNDAEECQKRQTKCVEFIDEKLQPLLEKFEKASVLICSDHGDCWGEDGLWEHGIHHEKVLTVPLIIRLESKSI